MFWFYIYIAILVISLIIEFCTSEMVSLWFCGGAIVSAIIAILDGPWFVHLPIFIIVSLVLLLCFRKITLKFFDKGDSKTNATAVIGKEFELLTGIEFNVPGTIKINGVVWNAVTNNEKDVVPKGTVVKIKDIKGNKYIVEVNG